VVRRAAAAENGRGCTAHHIEHTKSDNAEHKTCIEAKNDGIIHDAADDTHSTTAAGT